jgi:deoxyribodipyrimidine photolyase
VIRTFVDDVRKLHPQLTVNIVKGSVNTIMKHLKAYTECIYDKVDDIAWERFDTQLHKAFPSNRRQCVNTHTLLDWSDDAHMSFLSHWSPKRHNQSFKDYVFSHSFSFAEDCHANDCRKRTHKSHGGEPTKMKQVKTPKKKQNKKTKKSSSKLSKSSSTVGKNAISNTTTLDIPNELQTWKAVMKKRNITPFEPPPQQSCEAWALEQLCDHAKELSSSKWKKPQTQSILSIREQSKQPYKTTSKLSPFFALGVLSTRFAYCKWQGLNIKQHSTNAKRQSSAIAQLLWREEFHACASLPKYWYTRKQAKQNIESAFWKRDLEWDIWDGDDERLKPFLKAQCVRTTKKDPTPSPAHDTNNSLYMLAQDGWIHHLRRHVIADYLTRGYLHADWMLGESWFRQTLVDHDASVNRGNWLWLSACDFSTAQLCRHYNHEKYVRKQSGVL